MAPNWAPKGEAMLLRNYLSLYKAFTALGRKTLGLHYIVLELEAPTNTHIKSFVFICSNRGILNLVIGLYNNLRMRPIVQSNIGLLKFAIVAACCLVIPAA